MKSTNTKTPAHVAPKKQLGLRVIRKTVLWVAFLSTVFSACRSGPPGPIALALEDMCSYCRMAISNKRYAAEFIDKEGQAFKFDDIGCMISYINNKKNRDSVTTIYVNDYNTGRWVRAEDARYLRSKSFDTPMNFGIVAFREVAGADAARDKFKAEGMLFDDLFRAVEAPQAFAERN